MNNDKSHDLIITSRNHCEVTGISEVLAFDDSSVYVSSSLGELEIEGDELRIIGFSAENGILKLTGHFCGVIYYDEKDGKHTLKKKGSRRSV